MSNLPPGTQVENYHIKSTLGGGGFSVVYLAVDNNTGETVVLKEYFPAKLAKRDDDLTVVPKDEKSKKLFLLGRKLFFQEAGMLAAVEHPNIVRVLGFCHSNGTVYTAMSYESGMNLQALLKRRKGQMPESRILELFLPILDALQHLHQDGLLHLDIKPGNIYIREIGDPLLLDFGAVHKILRSAPPRLFPVVTHGFSPPEQSSKKIELGPWTDLYAVGATMRTCIEGRPPPSAKERRADKPLKRAEQLYAGDYSKELLAAIDWCMYLPPEKRPQDVAELLLALPQQSVNTTTQIGTA